MPLNRAHGINPIVKQNGDAPLGMWYIHVSLYLPEILRCQEKYLTFRDSGHDLRANPRLRPTLLHGYKVVRLDDGLHDCGLVQWSQGPQVDNFDLNPFSCK